MPVRRSSSREIDRIICSSTVSLVVTLALVVLSCGAPGRAQDAAEGRRVTIADGISLELPAGLEPAKTEGADSVYRRYRGDSLRLSVDYGWYADPLERARERRGARRSIEVDGRAAVLVIYEDERDPHPYVAALHVPDLGRGAVKLTLLARGRSQPDRERAVRAFHSLRFEASTD